MPCYGEHGGEWGIAWKVKPHRCMFNGDEAHYLTVSISKMTWRTWAARPPAATATFATTWATGRATSSCLYALDDVEGYMKIRGTTGSRAVVRRQRPLRLLRPAAASLAQHDGMSGLVQIVQWVSECDATPVLQPMLREQAIAEIAALPPNARQQFDLQWSRPPPGQLGDRMKLAAILERVRVELKYGHAGPASAIPTLDLRAHGGATLPKLSKPAVRRVVIRPADPVHDFDAWLHTQAPSPLAAGRSTSASSNGAQDGEQQAAR